MVTRTADVGQGYRVVGFDKNDPSAKVERSHLINESVCNFATHLALMTAKEAASFRRAVRLVIDGRYHPPHPLCMVAHVGCHYELVTDFDERYSGLVSYLIVPLVEHLEDSLTHTPL